MIQVSKPSIGLEEIKGIEDVINSGWLGIGPKVEQFENSCCNLIGSKYFIGLSSGTKALEIGLMVSGARAGDEVLVPSLTYAATIQSILNLSLIPVFVDSSMEDGNMSIEDTLQKISLKTRFIMPVHFRGRSCNMDALTKISQEFHLKIIEDAAHAFASKYKGTSVGQNSHIACFSFGPIKNITCGSGGGIATNDESIAKFIFKYRNMGISRSTWDRYDKNKIGDKNPWEYKVISPGGRCYLPEINAAIGLAQLDKIENFKRKKKKIIQTYEAELYSIGAIDSLLTDVEEDFIYIHSILIPQEKRDGLMKHLMQKGIHTSVHYPANHLQPYFKQYCDVGLKTVENLCARMITLPSYMDLKEEQQAFIIEEIKHYFSK